MDSLVGNLENHARVSVAVNRDLVSAFLSERYFVNRLHILQEPFSHTEQYSRAKELLVSLAICLTPTDDGGGYGLPNIKDRMGAVRLGTLHKQLCRRRQPRHKGLCARSNTWPPLV